MGSGTAEKPTVLIVDDEEDVAETYALRLQDEFETRVVYGGQAALEAMDDEVDAVLLDRRMPDIHGDEVLDRLREDDYDCPVIMATAVDPDLNILEMDFDDYLCKPIYADALEETLQQHLETSSSTDADLDEFLSLVTKIDILEDELTHSELTESETYTDLKQRADTLGTKLRDRLDDFDEVLDTYREIDR